MSIAQVYLSIFPDANVQMAMDKILEDAAKIRGEMGNLQRHQLRVIPELHFHIDETIAKMERIDELLKQ